MEATNRVMALTFKGGIRSIGFKKYSVVPDRTAYATGKCFYYDKRRLKVSRGHKARHMPVVGIGERVFRGQVIADTLPDEEGCHSSRKRFGNSC